MTKIDLNVQAKISFLTKHGKQNTLAPILLSAFNTVLVHTDKFDTDTLGTFDQTIARKLNPIECALKKAYLACELSGCEQGIGSEGSFSSLMGMGVIDEEFLAFVDIKRNIEIVASAKQSVRLGPVEANDADNLYKRLAHYDKSGIDSSNTHEQKWMLKHGDGWIKGLSVNDILANTPTWPVYIEPDFRAMHCPQRRAVIGQATHDLVRRLNAFCPQCCHPNFVPKFKSGPIAYLPCELCGKATTKIVPLTELCNHCGFSGPEISAPLNASAFYCGYCNP
jgi:hypothetical protein